MNSLVFVTRRIGVVRQGGKSIRVEPQVWICASVSGLGLGDGDGDEAGVDDLESTGLFRCACLPKLPSQALWAHQAKWKEAVSAVKSQDERQPLSPDNNTTSTSALRSI